MKETPVKKVLAAALFGLAIFAFPQIAAAKCCCHEYGEPVALSANDGKQAASAPQGYQPQPAKPEKTSWQDDVRRQQDNRR
jgi:hypothetical protein